MNIKKILKYILFILIIATGALMGVPLSSCIHESGHFIPAYIFDKSQINQTRCFIPENFFSKEAIMNLVPTGEVTYNKSVFEAFPFYQALITTIMGPIFQLILFIFLLFVLNKSLKRQKEQNSTKYLLLTLFLFGLVFGSSQLTIGWVRDINLILLQYTNNMSLITSAILGIYYMISLFYYFIVVSFVFRFGFILLPKAEKRFKSNKLFRLIFGRTT
jgi:glycosyltransferase involved in cell wall biosynthesis